MHPFFTPLTTVLLGWGAALILMMALDRFATGPIQAGVKRFARLGHSLWGTFLVLGLVYALVHSGGFDTTRPESVQACTLAAFLLLLTPTLLHWLTTGPDQGDAVEKKA